MKFSVDVNTQTTIQYFENLPDCALVRLKLILHLFPCSRATFWRWVKVGRIPQPKKMGSKISVWTVGEIKKTLNSIADGNGVID